MERDERAVRIKAMNIMSAGENTPRMLYDKLCEKLPNADRSLIKSEIRLLMQEGIVDERRYGERLVELCRAKLYGRRRILTELRNKKFTERSIEHFSRIISDDEDDRAFSLLIKRLASSDLDKCSHDDPDSREEAMKEKQRVFAYMQRMGYDTASVKNAFERYSREYGE